MANGGDAAVDELAAFVRESFAAPLARVQATAAAASADVEGGSYEAARDALVPALRKTLSTTGSSSAAVAADASAWKRVLLLMFRRFADHLVVRGKLLNQEELLVSQFCRVDARGHPHSECVRVPESLALRFVLPCEDGPVERVGHEDVVARVARTQAYSGCTSSSGDVTAVIVVAPSESTSSRRHDEGEQSSQPITPSLWEEPRLLTDLDTLYGFDVHALLQTNGHQMVTRLVGENDDAANAIISRTLAFSDLRCTKVMMQSYGIQKTTAPGFESFVVSDEAANPLCTGEAHPRSYISLGKAQKRRWADERLAFGEELAAKGRLKDAVAEFSSCLKLEEAHAEALFARGEAFVALQQFPDAIRDFEAVRRLDAAFPGLDATLLRAQGKLRHSRHVEIPSSLSDRRKFISAAAAAGRDQEARQPLSAYKSKSGSNVDTRPQDITSRSRSPLYYAAEPVVADSQKLERDRLRRLLEEEVSSKDMKEKRQSRRKRSSRSRPSSNDDDSGDSGHSSKKRKHASKKKTKRKKHEKRSKKSSRSHRKRSRRHSSSDDDRSSDSDSSSSSSVRRSRRKKSINKSKRDDSSSSRAPSREAEPEEPLHPILQRQRHRIWN
ncbi:hypothetical protein Gpo141_00005579 [Globisporangium polare]